MDVAQLAVVTDPGIDWVGGVLVPVAAILVSSGIALFLAARERRATERAHLRAEAARVIAALTELQRAAGHDDLEAARAASADFAGALNTFAAYLPARDVAVAKYLTVVMSRAVATGDLKVVAGAALFLASAIDAWLRGTVTTGDFASNMPDDTENAWLAVVDLSEWSAALDPDDPRWDA